MVGRGRKKRRILVLDDEPAVRQTFSLAFPEYEFVGTDSPTECLNILRSPNDIGLVVLDVVMPGINGIQVLRQIREIDPEVPVIVCTAYGSKDVVVEALRNGANDFVDKPFNVKVVREMFRRMLKDYPGDPLQRAYEFLKENFHTQINLESVSKEVNLHPKYLSRRFRERFGVGFMEEKLRLRMEKAKELLRNKELDLEFIAYKVGYSSPEAFSRAFKEIHGVSPSEYRKSLKGGRYGKNSGAN